MPRPKGPPLTREKHYRCTEEEARLEEAIVQRYAEEIGGSSQSGTAWYRSMLKREAKRWKVRTGDVGGGGSQPEAAPAPAPKTPRRRATSGTRPGRSTR